MKVTTIFEKDEIEQEKVTNLMTLIKIGFKFHS